MKTAATAISVNGTSTAEELLELDKISDEDLKVIKAFGKPIIPKLENYVTFLSSFYHLTDWYFMGYIFGRIFATLNNDLVFLYMISVGKGRIGLAFALDKNEPFNIAKSPIKKQERNILSVLKSVSLICLLLFLAGCSDTRPFIRKAAVDDLVQPGRPEDRPNHQNVLTFFALGDWGTGKGEQKAVAAALRKNVGQIPPGRKVAPFVLGLGDNVYQKGLPEGWNNPKALSLLDQTFGKMFSDVKYEGNNITFHIVPGNHDHNDIAGGKGGLGDVINQETTAEKLYANWEYYPIDPAKNSDTNDLENYLALKKEDIGKLTIPQKLPIESAGKVSIIAIDTQVLLNLYENSKTEVLQKHLNKLESLLQNDSKWKFIIGHHPIKSHGTHGGFRKAIWWVPPIILATIVDILFIKRLQDIDNRYSKKLTEALGTIMKKYPGSFYLAGHEHSLQFLEVGKNNLQIVSGSAAKVSGVTHKSDTIFSHSAYGFARFDITDEELWIEFFEVNVENEEMNSTALFKVSN